jgi:hypothetical protein
MANPTKTALRRKRATLRFHQRKTVEQAKPMGVATSTPRKAVRAR